MTDVLIRPARLDDAESLYRHCYSDVDFDEVRDYLAWSLRLAEKGRLARFVAQVDGQAVGNVQLTMWGETGEVGSLVVGEAFRRRGLARRLLLAAIAQAKKWGLRDLEIQVDEHQPDILAFYERVGFRVEGIKNGLSHSVSPAPCLRLRMRL